MRVHVVSDVHGNVEALSRAGEGADALIVLGDLICFIDYHDHSAGIMGELFGPAAVGRLIALRTSQHFDAAREWSRALWAGVEGDRGAAVLPPARRPERMHQRRAFRGSGRAHALSWRFAVSHHGYDPPMAEKSTQSITIAAHPSDVMAVIADFDSYPEWAASVKSVEIVEAYDDGYASQVQFQVDAGPIKDEYTLVYEWAEDDSWVSWSLVNSAVMKSQYGSYEMAEIDGGTEVTYTLQVETNIPMLGLLRRKIEKTILDIALKELKKRVEG